ncbi:beta-ketoacyl-[acyl-carrier-protein] synthase family protein [bacterium]|nr:beta-ketoacyl-[acyl-carrier-protein] synthase family protein [bacterium]
MKRRVVITGIGVIAPNGIGKENFWDALKEGKSGIKKISLFDASELPVQIAGEVSNFRPEEFIEDRKKIRRMARFSQFAVAAAKMAIEDAGLDKLNRKFSVMFGVGSNSIDIIEDQHSRFVKKGTEKLNPFATLTCFPHAPAGEIAEEIENVISSRTISTSCVSSLDAIGLSYKMIKSEDENIILCGGVDAPITPLMVGSFYAAHLLSSIQIPEKASRPFDKYRNGGVISEGCGVVILEEMKSALLRGAKIYGEIIGYGSVSNRKGQSVEGMYFAMKSAIENAQLSSANIDYISAHAPSDPELDKDETIAIKEVFGNRAYFIPVSSIKSMIGNPIAASGVIQLISCLWTIEKNCIPPTINYEYPDSDCDLDYVPNFSRKYEVSTAIINSHGLGAANSSVIVRRVEL